MCRGLVRQSREPGRRVVGRWWSVLADRPASHIVVDYDWVLGVLGCRNSHNRDVRRARVWLRVLVGARDVSIAAVRPR